MEEQISMEDEIPQHLIIKVSQKARKRQLLNEIYRVISDIREENSFQLRTVVEYTRQLMEILQKYPEYKGVEKRDFVLFVLKKAAEKHTSGEAQMVLMVVIDQTVPPMIDVIIKAKNGELDLGDIRDNVKEGVVKCCAV